MFTQIKATHDPYDIDALTAVASHPQIERLDSASPRGRARRCGRRPRRCWQKPDGIDRRNGSGRTALYEASKRGHTPVVALLLQHGANPNTKANQGYTPLLQPRSEDMPTRLPYYCPIEPTSERPAIAAIRPCIGPYDKAISPPLRSCLSDGIPVNQKTRGQTALEIAQLDETRRPGPAASYARRKRVFPGQRHRDEGMAFQK